MSSGLVSGGSFPLVLRKPWERAGSQQGGNATSPGVGDPGSSFRLAIGSQCGLGLGCPLFGPVSSLVSGAGWTSLGSTNRNSPGGQAGNIGVWGAGGQGVQ